MMLLAQGHVAVLGHDLVTVLLLERLTQAVRVPLAEQDVEGSDLPRATAAPTGVGRDRRQRRLLGLDRRPLLTFSFSLSHNFDSP